MLAPQAENLLTVLPDVRAAAQYIPISYWAAARQVTYSLARW